MLIKVGGGISAPVTVTRGIRQGCPLSGQLYSLAIEPLLCKLRRDLAGFSVAGVNETFKVYMSAYADDITVCISGQNDVTALETGIKQYEMASSAKVNWEKSEGFIIGWWRDTGPPILPGGLNWGRECIKALGVFLGKENFKKKNWEGVLEKVVARLSKWKWLLPQLSYRGRVLVANNLVASILWHKVIVLEPPGELICNIQRKIVDIFWSGEHWTRAAVLYLPVHEGGQGMVDVKS